jgi:hypothetical protein
VNSTKSDRRGRFKSNWGFNSEECSESLNWTSSPDDEEENELPISSSPDEKGADIWCSTDNGGGEEDVSVEDDKEEFDDCWSSPSAHCWYQVRKLKISFIAA